MVKLSDLDKLNIEGAKQLAVKVHVALASLSFTDNQAFILKTLQDCSRQLQLAKQNIDIVLEK